MDAVVGDSDQTRMIGSTINIGWWSRGQGIC
jgi:hypothetical protein